MAQVDAFLKLDSIKGESRDSNHAGEIDVQSWHWSMTNTGTAQYGGGAGSGKVQIADIVVQKRVDTASPILMQACATGKHIATGVLTVRKSGGDDPLEYFKVELTEILVSNVSDASDPGSPFLLEQVSLNFATCKVTYTPQDASGAAGASVLFGYDIAQNKIIS